MSERSAQQLAEFLAVVSACQTEASVAAAAVEHAAKLLDAQVAAIVGGGELVAAVGYPEGAADLAELDAVIPGLSGCTVAVPGGGRCPATAAWLGDPPHAKLLVARRTLDGLSPDDAGLLSAMARITSLTMDRLRLLDDERSAREDNERRAAENARLLGVLTERQEFLEGLLRGQAALRRVATLVAKEAAADDIVAAVAEEAALLVEADFSTVYAFDRDYTNGEVVANWKGQQADGVDLAIGTACVLSLDQLGVLAPALRSGHSVRAESLPRGSGPVAKLLTDKGIGASVAAPIVVDGRVWGGLLVGTMEPTTLAPDTEQRMTAFAELVAAAISNTQTRSALRRLADEQASLHRVATLVARGAEPATVFATVTEEVSRLFAFDLTAMVRMGPDGTATLVASHGAKGDTMPVGLRFRPVLPSLIALVAETGRSARVDDYEDTSAMGAVAAVVAGEEIRSSVGCPIIVEGQLWGQITVASREGPLPADSEQRIMAFTELVATAIANAQNRAEVTASRARIVTASDETRRRIERDLHDGIQQRLVTLALDMRTVGDTVAPQSEELAESVSQLGDSLRNVIDELHEIARGVHPAILSEGGLTPAVKALARRSPVPMELHVRNVERLPEQVEVAAYYVVSEAITNTAKHARATVARVDLDVRDGTLHLSVRDDGVGGADPARGSGIVGLTDRVTALGGTLALRSPPGEGTAIDLALPINAALSGGRLSASVEEGDHSEDTPVVGVGGRDR